MTLGLQVASAAAIGSADLVEVIHQVGEALGTQEETAAHARQPFGPQRRRQRPAPIAVLRRPQMVLGAAPLAKIAERAEGFQQC